MGNSKRNNIKQNHKRSEQSFQKNQRFQTNEVRILVNLVKSSGFQDRFHKIALNKMITLKKQYAEKQAAIFSPIFRIFSRFFYIFLQIFRIFYAILLRFFTHTSRVFMLFVALILFFGSVDSLSAWSGKFLLNSYYNPNRLVFRLSKGSFECSMRGVAVPYYGKTNSCVSESFRKMSHLSIGYMQNNLDLEQRYEVEVVDGYCIVRYSNVELNKKIILEGYGVVNKNGVSDMEYLNELLYLQSIAIEKRAGLWNSFGEEMECFRDSY